MACGDSCNNNKEMTTTNQNSGKCGNAFVIIIVLYILLAIIIGSYLI